jgi:hypothetical protein
MTDLDLSGTLAPGLLNELVDGAAAALSDGNLSFGEIVSLGGMLAGKVNQIGHLSGLQKKALVLQVVDLALKKILASASAAAPADLVEKVVAAGEFAKKVLPSVLDVAVSVSRGKLNLQKPEALRKTCIASIRSLFRIGGVEAAVAEAKKVTFAPEHKPQLTVRKPSDDVQEGAGVLGSSCKCPGSCQCVSGTVCPEPKAEEPRPANTASE